ncbi:paramyosin [Teleopsis dalmanni]|uniref:paramyosin n=1 Tax=Teleopsis dalmanni TaxID=139649 RepID=UPI0018CE6447|nr:paramyosin [Teleopsis dalmanni]
MSSSTLRSGTGSDEQKSLKRKSSKASKLHEMDTSSSVEKDQSTGTDQQTPNSIFETSDQTKSSSTQNLASSRTLTAFDTLDSPRTVSKPKWPKKPQLSVTAKITETTPMQQKKNLFTGRATKKAAATSNIPILSKPRNVKKPETKLPKYQRPIKNSARMLPSAKGLIGTVVPQKTDNKVDDSTSLKSQFSNSLLTTNKNGCITVGDSEIVGLTARERVLEKNKLTVFEVLQKKLESLQSEFMQKFSTLKKVSPDKLKADYKFVTMVKNDEGRLIVSPSDLINMPKLPVESINDIKQKMKETSNACLMYLIDVLKSVRNKSSDDREIILEDAYNALEDKQDERIEKLFEHFQKYLDKKAVDYVSINERLQKEIRDTKRNLEATENELKKVKSSQEAKINELEVIVDKQKEELESLEAELDEKSDKIFEITSCIEKIEIENEDLKLKIKEYSEASDPMESKYISEIKTYKEKIEALTKKKRDIEEKFSQLADERDEIAEKFRKVSDDVYTAKIKLEEFKKKANNDLERSKHKYEENQHKFEMELEAAKRELERSRHKSQSDLSTSKEKLETILQKTQTQLKFTQEMLDETRLKAEEELTNTRNEYEANQLKLQSDLSECKKKLKATEKKSKSDLTALQDQLKSQQMTDADPNEDRLKFYMLELEAQKAKCETLKQEKKAICIDMSCIQEEFKDSKKMLLNAENKIRELTDALDYQTNIAQHALPMRSDDYEELMSLREAEKKKKIEIETLRNKINAIYKGEPMVESQGDYDFTSQNSTGADCKLVASLGEQNTKICKLNKKLVERDEEYKSLFKTLNHKQVDVVRYEHMIRLLVNNNERSQMLRVRMEEKLASMEDEIRHLQQTIRIYQQHIVKMI